MKANRLTLLGFKGQAAQCDIDLAKYTFVVGKNGTKKSSVVNGYKTALFGQVPESSLNVGCQDAVAQLEFDSGSIVKTVYNQKKTTHYFNGKAGTKAGVGQERGNILKMAPEDAEIFFRDGQYALDLKPEEFSKLIGSVIPKVPTAAVLSLINITPEGEKLFHDIYKDNTVDFDSIAGIYKELSERNRALNKQIAVDESTVAVLGTTTTGKPLEFLKKRRDELLEAYKAAKSNADANKDYEAKREEYKRKQMEISDLQNQLSEKPELVEPKQIEDAIDRLNRINKKHTEESELIAVLNTNIETSEKILKELSSNVCPISRKLVCTTDKSGIRSDLEKSIEDNKKIIAERRQSLASLETIKATTEALIKNLREKERKQQDYLRLDERLSYLRKNLPPVPVAPKISAEQKNPDDIRAELDLIDKDIASAGNAERSKQILENIRTCKRDKEVVESLRNLLAPKGEAYNVILDSMCGKLNQLMNDTAKELGIAKEYEFRVDNGMTLYGKNPGDPEMIPAKNMSNGERFLTHLLLISLINSITGVNSIVIDNMDCLDDENLNRVVKLLTSPQYAQRFDNILMAGVSHEDTMRVLRNYAATRNDVKVIELT